jgi:hypothetical protein
VSLSPGDEVPHMFTRKPRLQLEKFAINGAKRLLQHNRHKAAQANAAGITGLRIFASFGLPSEREAVTDCGIKA